MACILILIIVPNYIPNNAVLKFELLIVKMVFMNISLIKVHHLSLIIKENLDFAFGPNFTPPFQFV